MSVEETTGAWDAATGMPAEQQQGAVGQLLSYADYVVIAVCTHSLGVLISAFGLSSNMVNILVFYKVGFASTSSISLFSLAICDIFIVVFVLVTLLTSHPWFPSDDHMIISMRDVSIVASLVFFSLPGMGAWITAIVAVERSCCIAFPIKVKQIFTRKTIAILIGGVVIYQIASGLPQSFGTRLVWRVSPLTNRTRVAYQLEKPTMVFLSLVATYSLPITLCYFIVSVGTIFLIRKFKESRKLQSLLSSRNSDSNKTLSAKDMRLIRSAIFICTIFIIGSTPGILAIFIQLVYPSMHVYNPVLGNIHQVWLDVGLVFQALNSSVNIFVHLTTGSKFKSTFKEMFLNQGKK
ncbi:chemosensory receptor A [Elysia marginata]|uniref:Chemosensory receptor A n=1 Tax=Elysia marginata TaxID=1093978 RepID=A0AAV4HDH6_9GAST|nr:chemosensory receptor A [Elysia marginata]